MFNRQNKQLTTHDRQCCWFNKFFFTGFQKSLTRIQSHMWSSFDKSSHNSPSFDPTRSSQLFDVTKRKESLQNTVERTSTAFIIWSLITFSLSKLLYRLIQTINFIPKIAQLFPIFGNSWIISNHYEQVATKFTWTNWWRSLPLE